MTIYIGLDSQEVIREAAPIVRKFIGQDVMKLLDWLRSFGKAARAYQICHWPKVLVCGGRDYANKSHVHQTLDMYHRCCPIELLIHGDAPGADSIADEWAEFREIATAVYPADWDRYGKRAGPIRNALMLDEEQPDVVLAFPGGTGTDNMIRLARQAGVPVHEVQDVFSKVPTELSDEDTMPKADPGVRSRKPKANQARSKGKGKSRT